MLLQYAIFTLLFFTIFICDQVLSVSISEIKFDFKMHIDLELFKEMNYSYFNLENNIFSNIFLIFCY